MIVFVIFCIIGGIILSFVQVNNDFHQLGVFYKGYMGRKLFIKEDILVHRGKTQVEKTFFLVSVCFLKIVVQGQ